jgi:magnesium transporter
MNKKLRSNRSRFHRRSPPGSPPGSLVVDPTAPRPVITIIAYDDKDLVEKDHVVDTLTGVPELLARFPVVWINVNGLGCAATIQKIGELFQLHPLALEDVVHVHQRPKAEQYGEILYLVARIPEIGTVRGTEQVSLFLGPKFVVTFLEDPGDCFDPVRQRLRGSVGRIRQCGAGYLAYALLDSVVDSFFPVLEEYGERLDGLEDEVFARPDEQAISRIHGLKRDLRTLRRAIWPLREEINTLARSHSSLIDAETAIYLRDCYDHTVQIVDLVETYRELCADLTDLYLSSLSNRLNEVMKVLTVIATVFMPLSFIAGVYGMNFNPSASPLNMPELNWYWGYPFALALMLAVGAVMVYFFYRLGWLGKSVRHPPPQS